MPINNYAFIDGNNLHLSFVGLGVHLRYDKLLSYLRKRHNVTAAYYFIGRMPQNQHIYDALTSYGYTLKFRDVTKKGGKPVTCPVCGKSFEIDRGKTKCDCDADLVLQVMDEIKNYDKAIIITSDGDFDNLVKKLITLNKLDMVLAPSQVGCSHLLNSAALGRIAFLDKLIGEIEKY
ncbi:MAG: NYN domain-containing protein [Dehalococcoidia bacterium]|nr:NYN domain-containing protein [Dehalococcoidia bacterium]